MNEEFKINIKKVESQYKIKKELPKIIKKSEKILFGKCKGNVVTYINYSAFKEMVAHALSSKDREVGGFLIGDVYEINGQIIVYVRHIVKALHAVEKRASVVITDKAWQYVLNIVDKNYENYTIVGWYHTHPGYGIFYSGHDIFAHKNFFRDPWHIGIVIDPIKKDIGFFYWDNNTIKKTKEFVLINDTKNSIRNIRSLIDLFVPATPKEKQREEEPKVERKLSFGFSLVVIFLILIFALGLFILTKRFFPQKTENKEWIYKTEEISFKKLLLLNNNLLFVDKSNLIEIDLNRHNSKKTILSLKDYANYRLRDIFIKRNKIFIVLQYMRYNELNQDYEHPEEGIASNQQIELPEYKDSLILIYSDKGIKEGEVKSSFYAYEVQKPEKFYLQQERFIIYFDTKKVSIFEIKKGNGELKLIDITPKKLENDIKNKKPFDIKVTEGESKIHIYALFNNGIKEYVINKRR